MGTRLAMPLGRRRESWESELDVQALVSLGAEFRAGNGALAANKAGRTNTAPNPMTKAEGIWSGNLFTLFLHQIPAALGSR